tara:strand:- start:2225 stop:2443 length:219 start_codon:yes stop_codon:yes gene_type:complete
MSKPYKSKTEVDNIQVSSQRMLKDKLQVINIGLQKFADDLASREVEVVQVDWKPPARGNVRLANLLAMMSDY